MDSVRSTIQVYDKWMLAIRSSSATRSGQQVEYTYEATGSGTGKQRLLSGTVDFAGSDSKLSTEQESECPGCWFVPSLAGAVTVGYNVPGLNAVLRIPREVLASIFRGDVRLWSELSEWNPALAGMKERIRLCVRADKSGTTEVFTSALSSFSSAFGEKPGISSLPEWPVSDSRSAGTAALARSILISDYSLGYLSLADARQWGVLTAMISNAEGEFVAPTVASVQAAMDAVRGRRRRRQEGGSSQLMYQSIIDPHNEREAYPIASFTYFAFDAGRLVDCDRLYDVVYLVLWALTDANAQKIAEAKHFAPLSSGMRGWVLSELRQLTCGGRSVLAQMYPVVSGAGASFPFEVRGGSMLICVLA